MTDLEIFNVLTNIIAFFILIEIMAAVVSVIYTNRIYRMGARAARLQGRQPSRIFRAITIDDTLKVIATGVIATFVIFRLIPIALPPWTPIVSGICVMIILWPPIDHAVAFRRIRRTADPMRPPPFTEED